MTVHIKHCIICGREFFSAMLRKKVCSHACEIKKDTANRNVNNRARKTIIKKTCTVCGSQFETTDQHRITCGGQCAKKNKNRLHNQWAKDVRQDAFGTIMVEAVCPGCGKKHMKRIPSIDVCGKTPRYFCAEHPWCIKTERDFYPEHFETIWESECRASI